MVCEKGGLQLWDCTRSSRRRIHQPLVLKTATVCTTLTRGYIQFTVWVSLSTEPSALREHEGRGRYAKFAYAPRMAGGGYLQGMAV